MRYVTMTEEEKKCPFGCDGSGRMVIDDLNVRECRCSFYRRLKAKLGPEIAGAPKVEGPCVLYWAEDETDLTKKNVVIRSYWTDLLPHLREALSWKGPLFNFKILTDEKLKTVYVGAEAYTSRARSKRDDLETHNSLNDIVGPEWDLLIIRLGHLGYKNVAMAGILKEALMLREVALKPTWLVESPQAPYAPGHFAYSEDTFEYIHRRFDTVEISEFDANRVESVAPQAYEKPRVRPIPAREHAPSMEVEETESSDAPPAAEPDDASGIYIPESAFRTVDKKSKYKPSKGKRRGSYGGGD
jgi:hypothetical protein